MTYDCSLKRAFKTPLFCDFIKVHTDYGLMAKVTACTEDENWGKVGSSNKGLFSVDNVIERKENLYWQIQVDNFQSWIFWYLKDRGRMEKHRKGKY